MNTGDVLNKVRDYADKFNEEANKRREKLERELEREKKVYGRLDDDKLFEHYRSSGGLQRTAAREVLKERGYRKSKDD